MHTTVSLICSFIVARLWRIIGNVKITRTHHVSCKNPQLYSWNVIFGHLTNLRVSEIYPVVYYLFELDIPNKIYVVIIRRYSKRKFTIPFLWLYHDFFQIKLLFTINRFSDWFSNPLGFSSNLFWVYWRWPR